MQETSEFRPEGFETGDVKTPPRKAAGFIAAYQKRMHETVYYHSVFIRLLWNILEEEEWVDIHKWDREKPPSVSHPVLFSVA